jgi:hypothetical protein
VGDVPFGVYEKFIKFALEVVSKPSIGPKIKAGCRFKLEE